MKLNVLRIIELIFPITEDERTISSCTPHLFSQKFQPQHHNTFQALTSFKDNEVRASIHLNKFHENNHARILLASLLTKYFSSLPKKRYLLIPIPLSKKRRHQRGHNQVTTIAKSAVAEFPEILLMTNILKRNRDTPPQTSLAKAERLQNLIGAFYVTESYTHTIAGCDILLLDDVATTGATLAEAKATLLLHNPATVTCLAIAH